MVSPCLTTQPLKSSSSAHPVPHIVGICSPASLHCPLQPHYGSAQIPPPPRSHELLLFSVSAQGCTLQRQEPQEIQREVQSLVLACSEREVGEYSGK